MKYYRATIQYDGTGYAGFQWQENALTIQEELNRTLQGLVKGKLSTMGASRTDSGVHAVEQVIKITAEESVESSLIERFNRALPSQIRCLTFSPCDGAFNPSVQTTTKEYRYLFTNKARVTIEDRRFIANISNELNFEAMNVCTQMILGKHDFCNFVSTGSNVRTTIREVLVCELTEVNPHTLFPPSSIFRMPPELKSCFQLRIEANGFLKQMIRHLIRGLWMVGSGKLTVEEFKDIVDGPKREKQLWKVASPNGLFLYRINYQTPNAE